MVYSAAITKRSSIHVGKYAILSWILLVWLHDLGPQPIISRLNRCRHEESRAREVWWGGSEHVKA